MRTLLVVDDNPSVRDSLRVLLESRGYVVVSAESGPEALERDLQHRFDGALIDVNMPGMSGLTVCRTLRSRAAELGRNLPVWLITGARTLELDRAAQEAGAMAVLGKPFSVEELFRSFDQQFAAGTPDSGTPTA
jgi:CheY-like chemotaxis protein